MPVPLSDLKAQYNTIREEIDAAIHRVLEQGQFILGPEVVAFEKEMAAYCGTKFAVGVASGTDALLLALLACGVGPGDEVITTPFTFIATAEAVSRCGAKPVFADIDPRTYNIDPSKIEARITPKTKAILPVHLYGQPAKMDTILELGRKHNLKIIEDCAQALGGEYKDKKVGSLGDAGCMSFFPAKNLGAYGDGGMVVTNDQKVAETVGLLRKHGADITYYHTVHGFNSRLDALQAAVLRVKLKYLDSWNKSRREKADLYDKLLGKITGIVTTYLEKNCLSSANYYAFRLKDPRINRDQLRKQLESKGISTAVYYPVSLHLQEVYKSLGYKKGDFPESELAQEQVISLPIYAELTSDTIQIICKEIAGIVHSMGL
jgi:dTDP-4-amino-4,6-dideoxygalactose transaminase